MFPDSIKIPFKEKIVGKEVYDLLVKDFATKDPVSIRVEDTIHDALELMGENQVSSLPVIDNVGECVGILSTVDLVDITRDTEQDIRDLDLVDLTTKRFLLDRILKNVGDEKVCDFMSECLVTVSMETSIGEAAKKMLRNHIHHLPVVDEHRRLVGFVSSMDLLTEFADAAP